MYNSVKLEACVDKVTYFSNRELSWGWPLRDTVVMWLPCNGYFSFCLQSPSVHGSSCSLSEPENNTVCGVGKVFEAGNGPTTGNCVPDVNGDGRCEIRGWCDVEMEDDDITYVVITVMSQNYFCGSIQQCRS